MKTVLSFTLILSVSTLFAQSEKYLQSMEATIAELYSAQAPDAFDPIINKFSRIGQAEKSQWEPFYYAALGHTFKSFRTQDMPTRDTMLDQAHESLNFAEAISENNAEIIALRGFIYMMQISVDPGTRGQTLSPKIMAAFGQAMKMDPENPRATMFMGQMQMGTAQFFGSGIEVPCRLFAKAKEL